MRLFKIFGAIVSIALRRDLAFRANLVFELLMSATGIGAAIAALAVVFTQTPTLGGWRFPELIVLLGSYQLMSGLLAAFIEPNLMWFANQVRDGKLDELLLKPVPSLFMASLGSCAPLALSQSILGSGVLILGLSTLGTIPRPVDIGAWLIMLIIGIMITWASRVLIATLALWAPGLQLDIVYGALWQFGRYPVSIYPEPLRTLLSSLVPVAFVATFPAQALMHGAEQSHLITGMLLTCVATLSAGLLWQRGLRRYTSATS